MPAVPGRRAPDARASGRGALLLGAAALLAAAGTLGCNACSRAPEAVPPESEGAARPVASAVRPRAPSFRPAEPAADSGVLGSPAWRLAAGGDPAALVELAVTEGAAGLLEVARGGGTAGRVALAALAHAPDAEAVVGVVCDWSRTADAADAALVLGAVHQVLARPPTGNERFDPDGVASCAVALLAVASRTDLDPVARDLGASALAMLHAGAPRRPEKGLSSRP